MSNAKVPRMIDRVNADSPTALQQTYDLWASTYDQDLQNLGYMGPRMGAMLLAEHITDPNASILDVGCGTGRVGQELVALDYSNLVGIDFSTEMMAVAQELNIYRQLTQVDLTQVDFTRALDLPLHSYDGAISIGVLGKRVPPAALDGLLRLLKPSGTLCFTVRGDEFTSSGYADKVGALVKAGEIDTLRQERLDYLPKEDVTATYCVLQVK